jgi:hypothetical protein
MNIALAGVLLAAGKLPEVGLERISVVSVGKPRGLVWPERL